MTYKNTKIDSNCDDSDKDTDQHEKIKYESSYSSHTKSNCEHDKNSTVTDFDSADSSSIRSSEKNCEKSNLESSLNDVSNENAVHAIIKKLERNGSVLGYYPENLCSGRVEAVERPCSGRELST